MIYAGKTTKCHPVAPFPAAWHITHTESHWSNEETMCQYIDKVLVPYFSSTRRHLSLARNHPCLLILDVFAAHRTESFRRKLVEHDIKVRYVPGGCTGELQPLDVAINDTFKKRMKDHFSEYYAKKVQDSLRSNGEIKVDLSTSAIKPLHARWLIKVLRELAQNKEHLQSGFVRAGITKAVEDVLPVVTEPQQPVERQGIFDILMAKDSQ